MGMESDMIGHVEYKTRVRYDVLLKHAKELCSYLMCDSAGFAETPYQRSDLPFPLRILEFQPGVVHAQLDARQSRGELLEFALENPEYCNVEYYRQNNFAEGILLTFVSSENVSDNASSQPNSAEQNQRRYLRLDLTHNLPTGARKQLEEKIADLSLLRGSNIV